MNTNRWDLEEYGEDNDLSDEEYENFDVNAHLKGQGYKWYGSTDRTDSDACMDGIHYHQRALNEGCTEFLIVTRGCDETDINFWVK